jgi:pyrroloquinoline quinone biosynthesis protein B
MERLGDLVGGDRSVVLTHLNNSNPVLDPGSQERGRVLKAGFEIARAGQTYGL